MLNKLLKGLFVVGISLIPVSFTNADQYGVDYYSPFSILSTCTYNTDNSISNNGNFTSYYNSIDRDNILYFIGSPRRDCSPNYFVFGRKNGGLYMFSKVNNTEKQGFLTSFGSCVDPASCTYILNSTGAINFLKENSILGLFARNYSNYNYPFPDTAPNYNMQLCFLTDNSITPYLCFFNQILQDISLTGGLGKNVSDWNDLASWDGFFEQSPIRTQQQTQVNEYSCPTVQQLLNTYENEYTTNLCYSSNLIYSGGTIQTVTPKSIFTLYPTLTNFTQDIGTYNSYCNNASTTTACQTMFENKEEEYTLIAKIPNNVEPFKLYQYCNLALNYDPSQTTCTASGTINANTGVTINNIITEIGEENYTVVTPGTPPPSIGTGNGTGSVYDNLITDENDTEWRNVVQNAKNIIQTMKELYAKITGIFRGREGTQGIIPRYITSIILLIVLFKLFKK